MSKLDKKQSIGDLLKGINQEEAKKLRIHELIKFALITPALILGIGYGGSIILGMLLAFVALIYILFTGHTLTEVVHYLEPESSLGVLIFGAIPVLSLCAFTVGGVYGIKKLCNLYKIQSHLNKMKRPLGDLLPDMGQAETKKLRNKELIKLILIAPALILGIVFGSGYIAAMIVGSLGGIYFYTSAAFTGDTDSLQVGSLFMSLIYVLRFVLLTGGFVVVGIYAVRKLRNLRKIKRHLNTLRRS